MTLGGPFFGRSQFELRPVGGVAEIRLGKMLQSTPSTAADKSVPYLRAGSLSTLGPSAELPEMFASPRDLVNYAVRPGDLVVAEGGDVGRTAFVSNTPGLTVIIQNSLHRVRPHRGDVRFLRYSLDAVYGSGWLDVLCNRSTFGHLTVDKLSSIRLPWPSVGQQRAIADYLDTETARIDALITAKRGVDGLLAARMLSFTESTVANPLKTSDRVPFKFVVREVDERGGSPTSGQLLSVSIHQGVVRRSALTDDQPRADDLGNYKNCRPGDLVINRMRAFHGGLGTASRSGFVSPDYMVLRPVDRVEPRYLHFLCRSPWFVGQMTSRLRGIGAVGQGSVRTPRVNFSDLGTLRVPVPPIQEQLDLAKRLDRAAVVIAEARASLQRQLVLLQEHRQALITAAVTGESDVSRPA